MSIDGKPQVVVLGGGTGTYTLLQALRPLPISLTVLLTMVDDGGSNRVLRDQFGLLPTSGICQCISALSEEESVLRDLFNYRYHQGEGITGMRFGNLFLAAVSDIVGSQKAAIQETLKLLRVSGKIFPISYDDVRLVAEYADGSVVVGEHLIDEPLNGGGVKIVKITTQPESHISTEAEEAIRTADCIIFGPGDFYTNTIANFAVGGVVSAVQQSNARKVFISNLMTRWSEAPDYSLQTYLDELDHYLGLEFVHTVLVNKNTNYPQEALDLYAKEKSFPVQDDIQGEKYKNVAILRKDLMLDTIFAASAGDVLQRSILRHDPEKLRTVFSQDILHLSE